MSIGHRDGDIQHGHWQFDVDTVVYLKLLNRSVRICMPSGVAGEQAITPAPNAD